MTFYISVLFGLFFSVTGFFQSEEPDLFINITIFFWSLVRWHVQDLILFWLQDSGSLMYTGIHTQILSIWVHVKNRSNYFNRISLSGNLYSKWHLKECLYLVWWTNAWEFRAMRSRDEKVKLKLFFKIKYNLRDMGIEGILHLFMGISVKNRELFCFLRL